MEAKARAFVEAFGATLFTQWTAQPLAQRERFWENAPFLQQTLEDAVAKLPQPTLRGLLRRDLAAFAAQLQRTLETQYRQHLADADTSLSAAGSTRVLLNEEDVERALVAVDDADRTASVLAREDAHAARLQERMKAATSVAEFVSIATECAVQLRVVRARRFESASERDGIEAFYLTHVVACVAAATRRWGRTWAVAASSKRCADREALRAVLQSLVVADALAASTAATSSQQPWSAFFRPQQSKVFAASQDIATARAGVYGALFSLAVAFPVVYDDDDDQHDNTSDDSSDDSDSDGSDSDEDSPTNRRKARRALDRKKKKDHEDCGAFAAHVARQIVLAAKGEANAANWYLAVLTAFHALATPSRVVYDDDEDDDDDALTTQQQRALHDARAELYARAFASSASLWTQRTAAPLALLEALLCLRHAAEFLRVERKQTVPAVATATTQLAGVALPSAFNKWMAHVKKVFAGEHAAVQALMKKLTKHKSDKKMVNVLLHDSMLTLDELRVVVEQFALFLEAEKERTHFVVARAPTADAQPQDGDDDTSDRTLFFQDNAGGNTKHKKKRVAEPSAGNGKKDATAARKRNRASA